MAWLLFLSLFQVANIYSQNNRRPFDYIKSGMLSVKDEMRDYSREFYENENFMSTCRNSLSNTKKKVESSKNEEEIDFNAFRGSAARFWDWTEIQLSRGEDISDRLKFLYDATPKTFDEMPDKQSEDYIILDTFKEHFLAAEEDFSFEDIDQVNSKAIELQCESFINQYKFFLDSQRYLDYYKSTSSDLTYEIPDGKHYDENVPIPEIAKKELLKYKSNVDAFLAREQKKGLPKSKEEVQNCQSQLSEYQQVMTSFNQSSQLVLSKSFGAILDKKKKSCTPNAIPRDRFGEAVNQGSFEHCVSHSAQTILSFESNQPVSTTQLIALNAINIQQRSSEGRSTAFSQFNSRASLFYLLDQFIYSDKQCTEPELPFLTNDQEVKVCQLALSARVAKGLSLLPHGVTNLTEVFVDGLICLSSEYQTFTEGASHFLIDTSLILKSGGSDVNYLKNLFNNKCKGRVVKKDTGICTSYSPEQSPIDTINDALNAGKPSIISIDSRLFSTNNPSLANAENSDHTVTVIDRRWDNSTNECQYLIRNSYGKDWGPEDVYGVEREHTEANGHIWINESRLYDGINSATYLSDKCN